MNEVKHTFFDKIEATYNMLRLHLLDEVLILGSVDMSTEGHVVHR